MSGWVGEGTYVHASRHIKHDRASESRIPRRCLDCQTTREVKHAPFVEKTFRMPGRVDDRAVDEDGEEDDEAHIRQIGDSFRKRSRDDRRSDNRKFQLEEAKQTERDGRTKLCFYGLDGWTRR